MANRFTIRHGSGIPTTNNLLPYELGWNGTSLYINNNNVIRQITQANNLGKPLVAGDNVDTLVPGVYYSSGSNTTKTLSGTKPNGDNSGFRIEIIQGYGSQYGAQIAYDSTDRIRIRKNSGNGANDFTGLPWQTIITSTNISTHTTVSNTWTDGTTAGPTITTTVNGVSSTAVAIPSASTSASGIVTTGNQTFAGRKTMNLINPSIYDGTSNTSRYRRIHFKNNSGTDVGTIRYDSGNTPNVTAGQFTFFEYSPKETPDSGNSGYTESYSLPNVTTGRTSNASYMILTSKTPVTIEQGGTGNTSFTSGRMIYASSTKLSGTPYMHFSYTAGTTSTTGKEELVIGNNIASGTENNTYGMLSLYSSGTKGTYLTSAANSTAWYTATLQAKTGTIALTSDLSSYVLKAGDTMTGNLTVQGSETTQIIAKSTAKTYNSVILTAGESGNHGIYSLGYNTTSSESWLIYRNNSNGKIYIPADNKSGNIVWSDIGRKIFVQTDTSVPSGAIAGDIVLVKA